MLQFFIIIYLNYHISEKKLNFFYSKREKNPILRSYVEKNNIVLDNNFVN